MPTFSSRQRLKIALGGFVSFVGFIVLASAIMTGTGAVDLATVFTSDVILVFVASVAALNVVCGVILALGNKEIRLSFASNQEKPREDADSSDEEPQNQASD